MLFASLLLATAGGVYAQPELVLTGTEERIPLSPYLGLLRDETKALTVAEVTAAAFEPAGAAVPHFGYTEAAYWARLRLRNAARTRRTWYLVVDEHDLARVALYRPLPGGGFQVRQAGTAVPAPTNTVRDLFYTFRIDLPPGAAETLYLRVETGDTMVLPLLLWTPEAYEAWSRREWLIIGLFLGMLGIMACYNGLLCLTLRDRSYLYYTLFLGCLIGLELVQDGVLGYFRPALNPAGTFFVPLLVGAGGVAMLLFTRAFLRLRRLSHRFEQVFRGLIGAGLLWLPVAALVGYQAATRGNNVLMMAGVTLCLGAGVYGWRRGEPAARLYLLACTPLLSWLAYFVLARSGLVPYLRWLDYGYQVTLALLALLLSWAQAARFRRGEQNRTLAQREALLKHEEALRLQDELNATLRRNKAELEARVAERTAALSAANAQLRREVDRREKMADYLQQRRLRLQEQNNVFAELAQRLAEDWGNLEHALWYVTEAVADALEVERVGVWLLDDDGTTLQCRHLYERRADRHGPGPTWHTTDYPAYDTVLRSGRIVAADEALTDPRTLRLADAYLRPEGITARLDVPIRQAGKTAGFVGFEQVGPARNWTPEEQVFGASVGDFVSLALEAHQRWCTEQALRESEERWRLLFDHSPLPTYILSNEEALVLYANRAGFEMLGATAEAQVLGHPASMFLDPVYHPTHRRRMAALAKGESPGITRFEVVRLDGRRLIAEVVSLPIQYRGRPAVQTVLRDVTEAEHVAAERERFVKLLEAKNDELERFTYTVSHDLKSPLFTIKGFIGLLREDVREGNTARVVDDLGRIDSAADLMQHLLDDLLELSRIGRLANPSEDVDLNVVAREAVELVAGRIAERGVEVVVAPDMPTVVGDRVRLREVFQNLLDNAIKFMGDQPEPRVEIGIRPDGATCFVRDNGIGIAPEHQEHIFELFMRLDKNTEGTGIGLPLVRRIVEVHDGRVWVESEGRGRGAMFCFTLGERA